MTDKTLLPIAALFVFLVLLSAFAQVLLKKSAMRAYGTKIREYVNPLVLGGYAIFVLCTFGSIFCYRFLDLKTGGVLQMSSYVFILVLDRVFFSQPIRLKKVVGMVLIMIGIFVFYLGS